VVKIKRCAIRFLRLRTYLHRPVFICLTYFHPESLSGCLSLQDFCYKFIRIDGQIPPFDPFLNALREHHVCEEIEECNIQFLSPSLTAGNSYPHSHPQSFCAEIVREVLLRANLILGGQVSLRILIGIGL